MRYAVICANALIFHVHLERMTLIRFRRVGRVYEWIIGYMSTIQYVALNRREKVFLRGAGMGRWGETFALSA